MGSYNNSTLVYLPIVGGQYKHFVPMGWALYGGVVPYKNKLKMAEKGERILNWYATDQWMQYPSFMPYLRGKDYIVPTQTVSELAKKYPGRIWCLWNEPDLPTQDWIEPKMAIDLTNEWVNAIGDNGFIAGYGVNINNSMYWAYWLDSFLNNGGYVPKYMHIHIYAENAVEWYKMYEIWDKWNKSSGHNFRTIISEAGGNLNENQFTSGWQSVYHFLKQWENEDVESVYFYTDTPQFFDKELEELWMNEQ